MPKLNTLRTLMTLSWVGLAALGCNAKPSSTNDALMATAGAGAGVSPVGTAGDASGGVAGIATAGVSAGDGTNVGTAGVDGMNLGTAGVEAVAGAGATAGDGAAGAITAGIGGAGTTGGTAGTTATAGTGAELPCAGDTPHGCYVPQSGNHPMCPPNTPEQSAYYPPMNEWNGCNGIMPAMPFGADPNASCSYKGPAGEIATCLCDTGLHWLCTYP